MEKEYSFTHKDSQLINVGILLRLLIDCFPCGVMIYAYATNDFSVLKFIIYLILSSLPLCYACKHLYYRWLMFQFDKESVFFVDTEHKMFTYKYKEHDTIEKMVTFTPSDIEKWWKFDAGRMSDFAGTIEFRLKDGRKIVISCGLEKAIDFIYLHSEELGLPEEYLAGGQSARYQSYKEYIEEIE